jgi:4-alpha-glucanotransferase
MVAAASEQLLALATRLGIETSYWDVRGRHHHARADALVATMAAMGVPVDEGGPEAAVDRYLDAHHRELTDPIVVWGGGPLRGHLIVPGSPPETVEMVVTFEGGGERRERLDVAQLPVVSPPPQLSPLPAEQVRSFELAGPWPIGYHVLAVRLGPGPGGRRSPEPIFADVLVAPRQVAQLDRADRLWGLFAPVYALAGGDGLGAHVGNLATVGEAIGGFGGRIVATLPLLASYLGEPYDPSPYAPVSRRFWNELFVDLAALPELAASPTAAEDLAGLASFGHAANIRSRNFDYRHQAGYVRGILEQVVAARHQWSAALTEGFAAHLRANPEVLSYARFRAFAEAWGGGWHSWPEPQRSGKLTDGDVDADVVALHAFGQYAMARDLARVATRLSEEGQRLYLDLPVGANGDGYDTWKAPDVFAWGASAGAPPDDFFADGQSWGFPPLRPRVVGNDHLFHVRDVVRHHLTVAGILRLDHAMSLERLFWVPDGSTARDGVYVRYPTEPLLAILTIESTRTGCVVVGEDLGTVSDQVREAMASHGLLGMYVAQFSQPAWDGAPLADPGSRQLASIDTHDTPTFAGWLHGLDIDRRHMLGQVDDDAADRARDERRAQVRNLVADLTRRGYVIRGTVEEDERAVLEGLLRFLGDSEAPAVLLAIDDLVGERNPQNVPGTGFDRPNWVQRVRLSGPELATDDDVVPLLELLQAHRLGAFGRAMHDET